MRIRTAALFAGSLLLFLYGSWQLPLLGPDEPRYCQIARQMLDSGDFIVPHLRSYAWFEKPVLLYWLAAASFWLFGINEFAARLPSALGAIATVGMVYHTVSRVTDRKRGLLSAFILATCAFFIGFSHAATFDMLLTFCVAAALCCFIRYEMAPARKNPLYWMYVFSGLGLLAKGFVALILLGLAIVAYVFISGGWRRLNELNPVAGILIVTGVAAIWFVPVTMIYGVRFWDEFFYQHHFVRYTSSHFHRSQGFLFYIPVLIAGMYPWTPLPFLKVRGYEPAQKKLIRIVWCWLITVFLFFSFSQSKLPGYILPAVPAFAILAGLSLGSLLEQPKKTGLFVSFAVLQIGMVAALFWGARKYNVQGNCIFFFAIAILVVSVLSAILFFKKKVLAAGIAYVSILPIGMGIFLYCLFPQLGWTDPKGLSAALPPGKEVVPYNVYDFGTLFYTNGRMALTPEGYPYIVTDYAQLHRYLMRGGHAYVLVYNEELDWMRSANFWKVVQITEGQVMSLVELKAR